jgi:hypothetical protein
MLDMCEDAAPLAGDHEFDASATASGSGDVIGCQRRDEPAGSPPPPSPLRSSAKVGPACGPRMRRAATAELAAFAWRIAARPPTPAPRRVNNAAVAIAELEVLASPRWRYRPATLPPTKAIPTADQPRRPPARAVRPSSTAP